MCRLCGLSKLFRSSVMIIAALGLNGALADVIEGENLVDPTRPLLAGSASPQPIPAVLSDSMDGAAASFQVSFIRASGTNPVAIVNNQRVTIGDSIGGAEIVAISRNRVTLLIDEQEQVLSIFDTALKAQ